MFASMNNGPSSFDTSHYYRQTCRLCNHQPLEELFSLGEQYVSDFVVKELITAGPKVPIEIVRCSNCTLVQQRYTAPQQILYSRHYWYRSGVTQTMRDALWSIVYSIETLPGLNLKKGDIALDIGSNDGTLLRLWPRDRVVTVGVEPAINLAEEGKQGVDVFIGDFWSEHAYRSKMGHRQAKVITAIGMFYDLENPGRFVRDIAAVLDDNGVFVAQLMCAKNMFSCNDVGNLCHEHLEFYTLESLRRLMIDNGLIIFNIEKNSINGESYRLYMKKVNNTSLGGLSQQDIETGASNVLRTDYFFANDRWTCIPEFYHKFFREAVRNKTRLVTDIKRLVAAGKHIWVYGASTKGNVLLQFYGLDHTLIQGASDRSPEKWGKYTVGTGIPIYSEEDARRAKPDYFLVLPYGFLSEFRRREAEWVAGGGRWLVPLPYYTGPIK